jgi:hypothetical protein
MRWYELSTTGHFGYPQPENSYAIETYDPLYCDRCAIGGNQVIPFRMRSEPKAHHSQFLKLNWVFDEIFVRPEVRSEFQSLNVEGCEFESVLHHKTGKSLESIYQLRIHRTLQAALVTDGLQTVTCKPDNEEGPPWHGGGQPRYAPDYPYCGRVKYHWPQSQPLQFYATAFSTAPDIVKSLEWFGSGGSASRAILASERVIAAIKKHGWRGAKWSEIELKS